MWPQGKAAFDITEYSNPRPTDQPTALHFTPTPFRRSSLHRKKKKSAIKLNLKATVAGTCLDMYASTKNSGLINIYIYIKSSTVLYASLWLEMFYHSVKMTVKLRPPASNCLWFVSRQGGEEKNTTTDGAR